MSSRVKSQNRILGSLSEGEKRPNAFVWTPDYRSGECLVLRERVNLDERSGELENPHVHQPHPISCRADNKLGFLDCQTRGNVIVKAGELNFCSLNRPEVLGREVLGLLPHSYKRLKPTSDFFLLIQIA